MDEETMTLNYKQASKESPIHPEYQRKRINDSWNYVYIQNKRSFALIGKAPSSTFYCGLSWIIMVNLVCYTQVG